MRGGQLTLGGAHRVGAGGGVVVGVHLGRGAAVGEQHPGEVQPQQEPFPVAAAGTHADAPSCLEARPADLTARVDRVPAREEVPVVCEEQLVVEYYSR